MRIQEITSRHRNDFQAVMVCERCGATSKLTTGYDDANYHFNVIPGMFCPSCGRNRRGLTKAQQDDAWLDRLSVLKATVNKWWGYLHSNGTIVAKRWSGDVKDYTTDTYNNDFVLKVVEPFEAADRDDALRIIHNKLSA